MADLTPLPVRHRPARRIGQLLVGLALFAFSEAMVIKGALGVFPWDVLSQGLVTHLGLTMGIWSIIIGVVVLLLWIPMRERPGIGTIFNALLVGLLLDPFLRLLPGPDALAGRAALFAGGVVLNGIATAIYIGSRLGPGPRDGLMTGLVRITGRSVRLIRTGLEVIVVVIGFLLGGNLGIGTVLFAIAIGPVIHAALPYVAIPSPAADPPAQYEGGRGN